MIKVSGVVEEIITSDQIALEALRGNVLNLSAYAKRIQKEVEKRTVKPVKHGTIVVALSRIIPKLSPLKPLKPEVIIDDISIKSPLCELTYEKTTDVLRRAQTLSLKNISHQDFFTSTQGLHEITIVCNEAFRREITSHFVLKPKSSFRNLVAITVRFSKEYLEVPNIMYTLINQIASRRINIIEIISTYTELSFIVKKENMGKSLEALTPHFRGME